MTCTEVTTKPTSNMDPPRSVEYLRRHVLHGAAEREAQLLVRALLDAAEVCELDVALPIQHYVLRLEVSVDDPVEVEMF